MAEQGDVSVDDRSSDRPAVVERYHSKYAYGRSLRAPVSPTACWIGLLFFVLSLSPTLLPRAGWAQGAISAISTMLGVAIGELLACIGRGLWRAAGRDVPRPLGAWGRRVFAAVAVVVVIGGLFWWIGSQNDQPRPRAHGAHRGRLAPDAGDRRRRGRGDPVLHRAHRRPLRAPPRRGRRHGCPALGRGRHHPRRRRLLRRRGQPRRRLEAVRRLGQLHLQHVRRRDPARHRPAHLAPAQREPRVARAVGHARLRGPQLRRWRAHRRPAPGVRRRRDAGEGADPRLRRAEVRRRPGGPGPARGRRARAHRCVRPIGARGGHRHRHRLGRPRRRRVARVHAPRRHRHRRHPVLLPAQLDLVPRRPRQGRGERPGAGRRHHRALEPAARGHPARAADLRDQPRLLRLGARLQRPDRAGVGRRRHRNPGWCAVGRANLLQPDLEPGDRWARRRLPGMAPRVHGRRAAHGHGGARRATGDPAHQRRRPRRLPHPPVRPGHLGELRLALEAADLDGQAPWLRRPAEQRVGPGGHVHPGAVRPDGRVQRDPRPRPQLRPQRHRRLGGDLRARWTAADTERLDALLNGPTDGK